MAQKTIAIKVDFQGTTEQKKRLEALEKGLNTLTKQRKRLNDQLKKGIITQDQWSKAVAKNNLNIKAYRTELLKTRQQLLGLDSFTKKLGKSFSRLGTSIGGAFVGLFAIQKFFQVVQDGIKTIEEFEQQMANVLSVTGATAVEFEILTDSAKELGRTSLFTSTEVAQLQEELAKLGFTTPEILAASEAILQLATASGSELSQSAVVAASTLRGFGLEATETQRIVDVMAKSFSSSSLDINKFQTAMAAVAPVAKTAGVSIEKTTALLGTLTDAGFDASTAGTGLRNILLEIGKRGITLEEAFETIRTSSDKTTTALELFDKRGAALAITLADNETKSNDLTESFNNAQGAAKDMADVMSNTSIGATKKLQSAWEGLILTIGEGSEEGFASFKNGLADLLNETTDFVAARDQLLESGVSLTIGDRYFGLDSDQAENLKKINKEQEFLSKNLKDREALLKRQLELQNSIRVRIKEEFSDANNRKRAADELNDEEQDRLTWLKNQRRIEQKALANIKEQLKTLKQVNEQEEANAKKAKIEDELKAKTQVSITDMKLSDLEKLDTEESKAEIKRRKEIEKTNRKIAESDAKLAKEIRKLKQEQLILEIKDKREAEFQKLSFAEENAIREIELTISTEDKKIEAIRAIQEKFQAERNKIADKNAADDAKKAKEKADKENKIKQAEKKKQDDKDAKDKKEQDDKKDAEKELLRETQIQFAEQTADLLVEISNRRNQREKDLALDSLNSQLEQGFLTQEEFDAKRLEIEKKAFEKQKRIDIAQAVSNGAVAFTKTLAQLGGFGALTPAGIASLALVGAQTASQVGLIASQKFEDGGLISGASHANGGVPFTVNGQGGFEAEGGEAIINKRSTAMFTPLLSAINQAGGGTAFANPMPAQSFFRDGGIVSGSQSLDAAGLEANITNAVVNSLSAIQVVNVATETTTEAIRVNNIVQESTFG